MLNGLGSASSEIVGSRLRAESMCATVTSFLQAQVVGTGKAPLLWKACHLVLSHDIRISRTSRSRLGLFGSEQSVCWNRGITFSSKSYIYVGERPKEKLEISDRPSGKVFHASPQHLPVHSSYFFLLHLIIFVHKSPIQLPFPLSLSVIQVGVMLPQAKEHRGPPAASPS